MAQNYEPQRDGIDSLQGRKVYHVVQQVAHAKPVAQHQPIFYGQQGNPTPMQDNSMSFHHIPNERLPSVLSHELPTRKSVTNHPIQNSHHPSVGGQPYYRYQIRNDTPADSNFTKAVAQSAYANQANIVSLTRTRPAGDSQISRSQNQGPNIQYDRGEPTQYMNQPTEGSFSLNSMAHEIRNAKKQVAANGPPIRRKNIEIPLRSPPTVNVRKAHIGSECLVTNPDQNLVIDYAETRSANHGSNSSTSHHQKRERKKHREEQQQWKQRTVSPPSGSGESSSTVSSNSSAHVHYLHRRHVHPPLPQSHKYQSVSHQNQNAFLPPFPYQSELKPSFEVSVTSHENHNCVPHATQHQQNWEIREPHLRCEGPLRDASRDPIRSNAGESIAIDSTASNLDTLDSGFSSDRFHIIHNHRPILPGDQYSHDGRGVEAHRKQDPNFDQHIYHEIRQPYIAINTSPDLPLKSHVVRHQQNVQNILVNMNRSDKFFQDKIGSNQVDINSQNNENNRNRTLNTEFYPRYSNEQIQIDKTRRGSYSEASSAYSGSDAMQSCENEPHNPDLEGLHESIVDGSDDEDYITDSIDSLALQTDVVRDALEKDPKERTPEDLEILLRFTQELEAFNNFTMGVTKAFCEVMVFAVVEKAGTVVMNDQEELDSWSVIINGEVRIDRIAPEKSSNVVKMLKCGDSFGINPTMEKMLHSGVMKTVQDDCQFVCITQTDYYKILNDGKSNQRRYEEGGMLVLVTETENSSKERGHKIIRGTDQKLLDQLTEDTPAIAGEPVHSSVINDPSYVEDFLLTHRTFLNSAKVMDHLLKLMNNAKTMDTAKQRVTRVLLLWVHNHFTDFETDPIMMEYLEKFEEVLEKESMSGQLRMLLFACAEKARKRVFTISRAARTELLQFELMGGHEKNFGIFVDKVEKDSKAAKAGLKRGDQILEVNKRDFEQGMTLQKAQCFLTENCHLELTVRSNLLDCQGLRSKFGQKRGSLKSKKGSKQPNDGSIPNYTMTLGGRKKKRIGKPSILKTILSHIVLSDVRDIHDGSSDGPSNTWDAPTAIETSPENSLKIFKSDGSSKYILVNTNTQAKEVVVEALKEFNMMTSEVCANYALFKVTVTNGVVKSGRLPDAAMNLAQQIQLSSRYYIKNTMCADQLLESPAEINVLSKESDVHLLDLNALELATQLMVNDFTVFRQIEPTEYVDYLFELKSKFGTPNLTRFEDLSNKEMMWVITEVVLETNIRNRAKIIKEFIKIAQHCYKHTQNFHSMFAITSALENRTVKRLKETWKLIPQKYIKSKDDMIMVMDPSKNFRKYRNLIQNTKPPKIPIFPMIARDLTFINLGNDSKMEGLVNFEKLRMMAKEVNLVGQMCSAPLDLISMLEKMPGFENMVDAMKGLNLEVLGLNQSKGTQPYGTIKRGEGVKGKNASADPAKMFREGQMVRRVKAYLRNIDERLIEDEKELQRLSEKCEAPPHQTHVSSSALPSSTAQNTEAAKDSTGSKKSSHAEQPPSSDQTKSAVGTKTTRSSSPTPSTASSASLTSHLSEGKKGSTTSTKFGADSPKAVKKLMALSEPGKTRQRKPGPLASSNPASKRTSSVSSLQSTNSNSSLHASSKSHLSRPHLLSGTSRVADSNNAKSHERSKSDVTAIKLSAESSSVTSLTSLKKGENFNSAFSHSSSSQLRSTKPNDGNDASKPKPPRISRTISRDDRRGGDDQSQISAV